MLYDPSESEYVPSINLSHNNIMSFTATSDIYGYVDCSYNPLTVFDLNSSVIYNLNLSYTSLTSLVGNGRSKFANFQHCQFTELDLTNVSFYWADGGSMIFLGNNPDDKVIFGAYSPANLTYSSTNSSFDLTNFGGYNNCRYHWQDEEGGIVRIIDCPNLNFLSMKNGVNYREITCSEVISGETWLQSTLTLVINNCPSLSFICVDEGEQDHIQEKIQCAWVAKSGTSEIHIVLSLQAALFTRFKETLNSMLITMVATWPMQQFLILNFRFPTAQIPEKLYLMNLEIIISLLPPEPKR